MLLCVPFWGSSFACTFAEDWSESKQIKQLRISPAGLESGKSLLWRILNIFWTACAVRWTDTLLLAGAVQRQNNTWCYYLSHFPFGGNFCSIRDKFPAKQFVCSTIYPLRNIYAVVCRLQQKLLHALALGSILRWLMLDASVCWLLVIGMVVKASLLLMSICVPDSPWSAFCYIGAYAWICLLNICLAAVLCVRYAVLADILQIFYSSIWIYHQQWHSEHSLFPETYFNISQPWHFLQDWLSFVTVLISTKSR